MRGPRKRRKLLESLSEGIHLSALAVTSLREDIQYHKIFHHLFGFNVFKVVYTIETKDLPWAQGLYDFTFKETVKHLRNEPACNASPSIPVYGFHGTRLVRQLLRATDAQFALYNSAKVRVKPE